MLERWPKIMIRISINKTIPPTKPIAHRVVVQGVTPALLCSHCLPKFCSLVTQNLKLKNVGYPR